MPQEYTEFTEITLDNTDWLRIVAYLGHSYIIKNRSGNPLQIAFGVSSTTLYDTDTQYLIGGITYELKTDKTKYIYVKTNATPLTFSIRPEGTIDPSEDITVVSQSVNDAHQRINVHLNDETNPHSVTKKQVGLGDIPNAKSDIVTDDDSEILATTKLTNSIRTDVVAHKARNDNPHLVNKSQVGLGNVPNYGPASDTDAVSVDVDDKLMTPKKTAIAVKSLIQIAYSIPPQLVVDGAVGTRAIGWSRLDCDLPSDIIYKKTNNSIGVRAGLIVTYAYDSKSLLSEALQTEQVVNIPTVNGTYYIFVNIDKTGTITSCGQTNNTFKVGMTRDGHPYDFFSIPQCKMFDNADMMIRRVYIGRVVVVGGIVESCIPTPIGNKYITPVSDTLALSGRYIYNNPFNCDASTLAEVQYNSTWGTTGWNDQIGIATYPHPTFRTENYVLQVGQMGFLCSGREGGSAFGASFLTITSPLKTRVIIERKF